jgi:hypothetical protein
MKMWSRLSFWIKIFAGCNGEPAVLLCDNCSTHCSDEVLNKFARHGSLSLLAHHTQCTIIWNPQTSEEISAKGWHSATNGGSSHSLI